MQATGDLGGALAAPAALALAAAIALMPLHLLPLVGWTASCAPLTAPGGILAR